MGKLEILYVKGVVVVDSKSVPGARETIQNKRP